MKYWDDLNDKNGFSDGNAIPADVNDHRAVYIRLLNALGKTRGSKVRVAAYDRGGCHNPCLVMIVPASRLTRCEMNTAWGIPVITDLDKVLGVGVDEPPLDDIMEAIISEFHGDGSADGCVKTVTTINEDKLMGIIAIDKEIVDKDKARRAALQAQGPASWEAFQDSVAKKMGKKTSKKAS